MVNVYISLHLSKGPSVRGPPPGPASNLRQRKVSSHRDPLRVLRDRVVQHLPGEYARHKWAHNRGKVS